MTRNQNRAAAAAGTAIVTLVVTLTQNGVSPAITAFAIVSLTIVTVSYLVLEAHRDARATRPPDLPSRGRPGLFEPGDDGNA